MLKRRFHSQQSRYYDGMCKAEDERRRRRRKNSINLGKIQGPPKGWEDNEKQLVQSDQRTVQSPAAGDSQGEQLYGFSHSSRIPI